MAASDRLLGGLLLLIAGLVFAYYTIWTFIVPFFPSSSPLQQIFPDRVWAIRLPALILVLGLAGVGSFVGLVMQKEARKRAEKEARRNN
ncbi:Dolichol phosphate-mannose regulatory protein (DPM2) [Ceraceosorus bombacis]|uniref:Dolichol phosphate-mannose biosynthesis regulatory protein n=1 Tax=Ceraceosorus bombacis TaxID=401625 RepID=A0A0P1BDF4_9BASI|nr:Dolichol phosphate-mannose regulatory protein (DPM2) [Ceraceosorus bombacis]